MDEMRLRIIEALEAQAAEKGLDIVDVEVAGTGGSAHVTVRLDHADPAQGTITLDEVSAQNDWVSQVVENLDPFSGSYMLEVSSPGMDRPLRREKDFVRFAGETVALHIKAYEGRKRYTGELLGMRDDKVVILADGQEFSFAPDEIKSCKIKPTYDFSGSKNSKNQE